MKRKALGLVALFGLVVGFVIAAASTGGEHGSAASAGGDDANEALAALPGSAPEAKDATAAMALAVKQGVPVEDVSQRGDAREVFAQPDGQWLARQWTGPVWVDQADEGSATPKWVLLDTYLQESGDQWLEPQAVPGKLLVAAGPAATDVAVWAVPDTDVVVTLVSPVDHLPAATVEGSRARYVNIEPGVDLVIDVMPEGFEQYYVIHDRAALAATGGIVTSQYEIAGGTARANGDTVEILDTAGTVIASIPQPLVWDAASDRGLVNPVLDTWMRADTTPAEDKHPDVVPDLQPASVDFTSGIDTFAVKTHLDQTWALSDERVFPLVVDPAVWSPGFAGDTYVQSGSPNTNFGASGEMMLGRVPGGSDIYRSYIAVGAGWIRDQNIDITSAVLMLWEWSAATCTPQNWGAFSTGTPDASTTWNHQPPTYEGPILSSSTTGHTSGSAPYCAQGWASNDVTYYAKEWQADSSTYVGLAFSAWDEGNTAAWKRFYTAESSSPYKPHFDITYNQKPYTPSGLVYTPPTATTQGVLKAVVSDPDGGSVRAAFTIERRPVGSSASWETMVDKQEGSFVASGGTSTRGVDLIAGFEYRFTASGYDGRVFSLNATAAVTFVNPGTGVFNDLPSTNDSQASAMGPSRVDVLELPNSITVGAER